MTTFQSQNGLILTCAICIDTIIEVSISIPKWSDFNKDLRHLIRVNNYKFQSQNGLILTGNRKHQGTIGSKFQSQNGLILTANSCLIMPVTKFYFNPKMV